jgi:hypothetical protein
MKTTCVTDPMSPTSPPHHIQQDLLSAIGHIKRGNAIANEHRKKAASFPFRLAGYVTGSSGANWVKSMTVVERHAELVYAESLFEKAFLWISALAVYVSLTENLGPIGDRVFRRLACIYQGSVRAL